MRNQRNSSVFTHIVIIFFLLVVFIYAVGLIIFNANRQSMINQVNNHLNKQVSIYFDSLKGEIDRIQKMHIQLLVNEDLNILRFKDIDNIDYDMTKSINRVIEQLDSITNISDNIECVSVGISKLGRTYNSRGESPSYTEHFIYPDISARDVNPEGITYINGEIHIYTVDYKEGSSLIAPVLIDTKLSKRNIQRSIKRFDITDQSLSVMVFNHIDNLILSDNKRNVEELVALSLQPDIVTEEDISGEKHIIITYYIDYFEATYIQAIPKKFITRDIDELKFWYYIFSFAVLFTLGIYTMYAYYLIKRPIDILNESLMEVQNGNFQIEIKSKTRNEFSILYQSFNLMARRLDKLINEVYMQKIQNQKAELKQLQAQINPHFLYNSFFILKKKLFRKQYNDAEAFCEMLEKYYHYISKNYEDYSTLEDEIYHAKIYANIQSIRFKNRIKVEFGEFPEWLNKCVVPKLILQPIIENAYKYGLEDKEFDGLLRVSYNENAEHLSIVVEDNGELLLANEENLEKTSKIFENPDDISDDNKEISGLLNIHKRIRLFTKDKKSGLMFSKSAIGGLKVVVMIKLNKELASV